ncbi:hypothetical protein ACW7G2_13390 [Luteimonas sp. A277]
MPIRTLLSAALVTLALSACEPAPTADTDPHRQPVAAVASGGNAFQVRVTLSEAAAGALGANGESIIVTADYFGYASVAAQQRQLAGAEEPWLGLARHRVELSGAGSADFPEVRLDPDQLQLVEEGRPHLRVDATSSGADADEAGEGELLDCGTFQDTLAAAVRSGVDIDCKLIAE